MMFDVERKMVSLQSHSANAYSYRYIWIKSIAYSLEIFVLGKMFIIGTW